MGYDAIKERARSRSATLSRSGRDIGSIPPVVDPDRKALGLRDFRAFCETYFPHTFALAWSPDHLRVIDAIERAVRFGELFAIAMPRGSGKSSICEAGVIWGLLTGLQVFVVLIAADEGLAEESLDSVKSQFENNDLLLEDFPEVCYPIRALEGIHQRASGQIHHGERTHIGWTNKEIILPTIRGSAASAGIIRVAGITGSIRGMRHTRTDGKVVRPSLVLIDDPQTDESAQSPAQCATRERIVKGAVLGLAGPGKRIAGLMTLTVVRKGDLADRLLNRDLHPEWQGVRTKMVYQWPVGAEAEALWAKYRQIWEDGLRAGQGIGRATQFYRDNQPAMDAGAVVAWPERKETDEASAIQHAMNLRFTKKDPAFFAEYQNEPLDETSSGDDSTVTIDAIMARNNGLDRRMVPSWATHLTAFVDVQAKALFYVVVAWGQGFSGTIIDYGTYPEQPRQQFSLREIRKTLMTVRPGAQLEGAIFAGLEVLTGELLGREWPRDGTSSGGGGGSVARIDRMMIDANWGDSTDIIYQFCRQSPHAALLMPSHGRYIGAGGNPMHQWTRKPGDRLGLNWRIPAATGRRAVRYVIYDTNWWKSFVHQRLSASVGDVGALTLFGLDGADPDRHRMIAEHLTSEFRVRTEGRGRTVHEWKLRVNGLDNHWFDGVVGCAVAASMQGVSLDGIEPSVPRTRRRVRMSEVMRAKR